LRQELVLIDRFLLVALGRAGIVVFGQENLAPGLDAKLLDELLQIKASVEPETVFKTLTGR
jgi:hypothetical protein